MFTLVIIVIIGISLFLQLQFMFGLAKCIAYLPLHALFLHLHQSGWFGLHWLKELSKQTKPIQPNSQNQPPTAKQICFRTGPNRPNSNGSVGFSVWLVICSGLTIVIILKKEKNKCGFITTLLTFTPKNFSASKIQKLFS